MSKSTFYLTLIAIFFIAIILRAYTFVFPHDHGDQIIYAALAQNIADGKPYNLLKTGFSKTNISGFAFINYHSVTTNNSIAQLYQRIGVNLYSDNIFYRPPLFPFFIQLFNQPILSFDLPRKRFRSSNFFFLWLKKQSFENLFLIAKKQFAVTFPSFFGSMLILFGVIFIASRFSKFTAVWAGLITALAPVDIFCASRVLPDSLMTALLLWAFIFAIYASQKLNIIFAMIIMLTSIYIKESAAIIFFAAFFIIAIKNKYSCKLFILSFASIIFILSWVFILFINNGHYLSRTYSHIFSTVLVSQPLQTNWYNAISSRSYFYHYIFPFRLYPVLFFSFLYCYHAIKEKKIWQNYLLIVPLITIIIISAARLSEARQILPAYPFLFIATALGLEKFRKAMNSHFQLAAGFVIILSIIIFSAYLAYIKIYPSLFCNAGDIFI